MLGFLLKNKGLSAVHIEHFAPARSVPGVNQERPHAAFGAATLRSTTDPALVFCSPPPVTGVGEPVDPRSPALTGRLRR
jgi:hypothetical protein